MKTNSQAITKKDLEVVAKLIKQFDNSTIEDNIFANRQGEGAYTDADVSFANDLASRAWGENLRSKKQQQSFAKEESK